MAQIFISYARKDKEFVLKLARDFRQQGIDFWLDLVDIAANEGPWDDQVQAALEACPYLLVVLSPSSVASSNVKDEIGFALDAGKTIITILYQDCDIPLRIRRYQYIDFRGDYEDALTKLFQTLAKALPPYAGMAPKSKTEAPKHVGARSAKSRDLYEKRHDGSEDLLKRLEWLHSRGFTRDPFPGGALRAEADPLFDQEGMPAFVEPPDFDEIRGSPDNPGYPYIFAVSGGGKSSLRRRIKSVFDDSLGNSLLGLPRVLAVEYIDHDYKLEETNTRFHVIRIAQLIIEELESRRIDLPLEISGNLAPRVLLTTLMAQCREAGLDGICILVDNVDMVDRELDLAFERIAPLATRPDLFDVRGIIFKFMLPQEMFELTQHALRMDRSLYHPIEWDKDNLAEILYQRLLACGDQALPPEIAPLSKLCGDRLSGIFEDRFIELGMELKQPRAMWKLGYYMLEDHFNQSDIHRRSSSDLIESVSLQRAYGRVMSESLDYADEIFLQETTDRTLQSQLAETLKQLVEAGKVYLKDLLSTDRGSQAAGEAEEVIQPAVEGNENETLIQKIKDNIANHDLEGAIELYKQIDENKAIKYQYWFKENRENKMFETITNEEFRVAENRLIDSLLQSL